MNSWWVGGTSAEIEETPISRMLLDQRIVIYRKSDGEAVALEDRCPHRGAPLSLGQVIGDEIACVYHGFRFDGSGKCVKVPSQPTPGSIKVRSYPVREKWGMIWLWMGDPLAAAESLLPKLPVLTDPGFIITKGYSYVGGNYMLIQENVLDLTHIAHLHKGLGQDSWESGPDKVTSTERTVSFTKPVRQQPMSALMLPEGRDPNQVYDHDNEVWFFAPSTNLAHLDLYIPKEGQGGKDIFNARLVHFTTPATTSETHYWWYFAQNYVPLAGDTDKLAAFLPELFSDDIRVIEAIQSNYNMGIRQEFSVRADGASVAARRVVAELIEREMTPSGFKELEAAE